MQPQGNTVSLKESSLLSVSSNLLKEQITGSYNSFLRFLVQCKKLSYLKKGRLQNNLILGALFNSQNRGTDCVSYVCNSVSCAQSHVRLSVKYIIFSTYSHSWTLCSVIIMPDMFADSLSFSFKDFEWFFLMSADSHKVLFVFTGD